MSLDQARRLVQLLTGSNPTQQTVARMLLISLQEDAVEPLIEQFYSGVNEANGKMILNILGEIGGPDALVTLRSVYHFDDHAGLRRAAAEGLLRNRSNLDKDELEELEQYVGKA